VQGTHTLKVGESKLNPGQFPLLLCGGEMALHVDGGQYATQTLSTHVVNPSNSQTANLQVLLRLRNYDEAYKVCKQMNQSSAWREFGEQAIADLEPDIGSIIAFLFLSFVLKMYNSFINSHSSLSSAG